MLDYQTKKLREKDIHTAKVLWDEGTQEATWELEDNMRKTYPYIFLGKCNFRG